MGKDTIGLAQDLRRIRVIVVDPYLIHKDREVNALAEETQRTIVDLLRICLFMDDNLIALFQIVHICRCSVLIKPHGIITDGMHIPAHIIYMQKGRCKHIN